MDFQLLCAPLGQCLYMQELKEWEWTGPHLAPLSCVSKQHKRQKGPEGSWGWWGLGDAGGNFYSHWNACRDPWSSRRGWEVSEGICVHACKESVASPQGWDTGSLLGLPLDAFTSTPAAALWAGVCWCWESWPSHLDPGLSLACGETNPMEQALLSTGVSHARCCIVFRHPLAGVIRESTVVFWGKIAV